jgi:MraZ protein
MFRGRHHLKLDSKGRVSIPARFRETVNVLHDGNLVISQGFFGEHPHLLAVPLDAWMEFESRFGGDDLFDTTPERFQARLRTMGSCVETRIDEHGRILVPGPYRRYAELEGEVVCVGMGRYMSLWSPPRLEEAMGEAEGNLEQIRSQMKTPAEPGDGSTSP